MSDTAKAWIEERRTYSDLAAGHWIRTGHDIYCRDDGKEIGEWAYLSDAEAIVDAHNTLPALLTAVEKVLELHKPEAFEDAYSMQSGFMCESCYDPDKNEWVEWPCPTAQAIERAINE